MTEPAAASSGGGDAVQQQQQQQQQAAVDGGGAAASSSAASSSDVRVGEEGKDSCVPKFDALWFCYSPAYQLQQYYINGRVDDCSAKWTALIECLKKRTKYKEAVLAAEAEVGGHPLWQIRTHAEAEAAWKKEFGHLEAEGGAAAGEAAEPHHSGKTTLV